MTRDGTPRRTATPGRPAAFARVGGTCMASLLLRAMCPSARLSSLASTLYIPSWRVKDAWSYTMYRCAILFGCLSGRLSSGSAALHGEDNDSLYLKL